jgi:tripartite-type tricarboxylate transporter receptor subunit TctC
MPSRTISPDYSLTRLRIAGWLASTAVIVATGSLLGADDAANHPNRAVRLLAASAAGGNPDVMARLLGDKLSKAFNNPSIVEDVPGVGGVIDANETVQAQRRLHR